MSDARLARWAAKGSETAFQVIYERHHQALHRYCHSLVGNPHDAADALQNTMLKALRALPGERRTIALKPWLYRIAHNESISLLRAQSTDGDLQTAEHVGDPAAATIVESRERLRELTTDLRQLTDQQRGALLMRELGGLAFAEVATALQVSQAAAKQSVYEARCALHDQQEGRAMDCETVRRTLSDGDRRTLRSMKIRGHLNACAGCQDFSTALHQRPVALAALTPPLPLAMAASILHGLLGGGAGGGGGYGGGLAAGAGIGTGVKAGGASGLLSLSVAKVATVVVVAAGATGGSAYIATDGRPARAGATPDTARQATANRAAPAVGVTISPAYDVDGSEASPSPAGSTARPADAATAATSSHAANPDAGAGAQGRGPAPASSAAAARRPSPPAGAPGSARGQATANGNRPATANRRPSSPGKPAQTPQPARPTTPATRPRPTPPATAPTPSRRVVPQSPASATPGPAAQPTTPAPAAPALTPPRSR